MLPYCCGPTVLYIIVIVGAIQPSVSRNLKKRNVSETKKLVPRKRLMPAAIKMPMIAPTMPMFAFVILFFFSNLSLIMPHEMLEINGATV